jgi:hypothetical protein
MARDIAKTEAYVTSRHERKKIEMLFAHLKRILRLDRHRLRGRSGPRRVAPGCHCLEPPKAGKADPAGCSEARLSTSVPAHASPFDPSPIG